MTRFFMSVQEAVQLVLQAAAFADGGEVFMLEMGEAVNILELGQRMVRLSGRNVGTDIAIRFTGTRPGEKLFEELRAPDEEISPTSHPSIVRIMPNLLDASTIVDAIESLARLASSRRDRELAEAILSLPTHSPQSPAFVNLLGLEEEPAWNPSSI
jgi:FlaA1/EpsC-like NDP-sugar epimerase